MRLVCTIITPPLSWGDFRRLVVNRAESLSVAILHDTPGAETVQRELLESRFADVVLIAKTTDAGRLAILMGADEVRRA